VFSPQDSASSLTVPQNDRQSSRLALLPIPVIALVLAFTAVPTEFRSLSHHRIRDFFGIGFDDFVANLVGYVPVGAVLANLATLTRPRASRDRKHDGLSLSSQLLAGHLWHCHRASDFRTILAPTYVVGFE